MRGRLPWLLFVLSLALNLFVVAGVLYSGNPWSGAPSPDQPFETVVERLGLDGPQRDQLAQIRERAIAGRAAMRAQGGRLSEVLVTTLEAPAFERAAFLTQMGERGARRYDFFADTMADLHGFLAALSPEQKATFLELARERRFLRRLLSRPSAQRN